MSDHTTAVSVQFPPTRQSFRAQSLRALSQAPDPTSSEVTTVLPASILTHCVRDDACYVFSKASRFVSSIFVRELWPCCVEQWLAPMSVGKMDALTLTGGLRWGWDEVGH